MKIGIILLMATFMLSAIVANVFAQEEPENRNRAFKFNIGISRYYVDPDIDLELAGISGEIGILFSRDKLDFISKNLLQFREITLEFTKVLKGNIDVFSFGLAYGSRYDFPRFYLGFGAAPFTYYLYSTKKTDPQTGYSVKTGFRLNVYYIFGIKCTITEKSVLAFQFKYNFTVYDVRWHNPFVPHKHEDIFHYFTVSVGVIR